MHPVARSNQTWFSTTFHIANEVWEYLRRLPHYLLPTIWYLAPHVEFPTTHWFILSLRCSVPETTALSSAGDRCVSRIPVLENLAFTHSANYRSLLFVILGGPHQSQHYVYEKTLVNHPKPYLNFLIHNLNGKNHSKLLNVFYFCRHLM